MPTKENECPAPFVVVAVNVLLWLGVFLLASGVSDLNKHAQLVQSRSDDVKAARATWDASFADSIQSWDAGGGRSNFSQHNISLVVTAGGAANRSYGANGLSGALVTEGAIEVRSTGMSGRTSRFVMPAARAAASFDTSVYMDAASGRAPLQWALVVDGHQVWTANLPVFFIYPTGDPILVEEHCWFCFDWWSCERVHPNSNYAINMNCDYVMGLHTCVFAVRLQRICLVLDFSSVGAPPTVSGCQYNCDTYTRMALTSSWTDIPSTFGNVLYSITPATGDWPAASAHSFASLAFPAAGTHVNILPGGIEVRSADDPWVKWNDRTQGKLTIPPADADPIPLPSSVLPKIVCGALLIALAVRVAYRAIASRCLKRAQRRKAQLQFHAVGPNNRINGGIRHGATGAGSRTGPLSPLSSQARVGEAACRDPNEVGAVVVNPARRAPAAPDVAGGRRDGLPSSAPPPPPPPPPPPGISSTRVEAPFTMRAAYPPATAAAATTAETSAGPYPVRANRDGVHRDSFASDFDGSEFDGSDDYGSDGEDPIGPQVDAP